MTSDELFWFALFTVLRSGVLAELEFRFIVLSANGTPLGRPGLKTPLVAVLVGGVLACGHQGAGPTVEAIRSELDRLDPRRQALIGVADPDQRSIHAVGHTWNRLLELLNPADRVAGKAVRGPLIRPKRRIRWDCEHRPVFQPDCAACNRARDEALRRDGCPEHPDSPEPGCEDCQKAAQSPPRSSRRGAPREKTAAERDAAQKLLNRIGDLLLQATVPDDLPVEAIAVDWTDHDSYAYPPDEGGVSAAPGAGKGRRRSKPHHGSLLKRRSGRKPIEDPLPPRPKSPRASKNRPNRPKRRLL